MESRNRFCRQSFLAKSGHNLPGGGFRPGLVKNIHIDLCSPSYTMLSYFPCGGCYPEYVSNNMHTSCTETFLIKGFLKRRDYVRTWREKPRLMIRHTCKTLWSSKYVLVKGRAIKN